MVSRPRLPPGRRLAPPTARDSAILAVARSFVFPDPTSGARRARTPQSRDVTPDEVVDAFAGFLLDPRGTPRALTHRPAGSATREAPGIAARVAIRRRALTLVRALAIHCLSSRGGGDRTVTEAADMYRRSMEAAADSEAAAGRQPRDDWRALPEDWRAQYARALDELSRALGPL